MQGSRLRRLFLLVSALTLVTTPAWAGGSTPAHQTREVSELMGVSALDQSNVWAVGLRVDASGAARSTIEHFDGTRWASMPHPQPGPTYDAFQAVSADSADDAWAVGSLETHNGDERTLAEHWNGRTWAVTPSPSVPGAITNELRGVAVASPHNAWVVGHAVLGGVNEGLVEHWDGSSWTLLTSIEGQDFTSVEIVSPHLVYLSGANGIWRWRDGTFDEIYTGDRHHLIYDISVLSPDDIWAAGSVTTYVSQRPALYHWDGTSWSILQTPVLHRHAERFVSLSVASDTNIWAAGGIYDQQGIVEHWNGSHWQVFIPLKGRASQPNQLVGIARVSDDDVWAVGSDTRAGSTLTSARLHWNGSSWSHP
jgi:hypothetical protein